MSNKKQKNKENTFEQQINDKNQELKKISNLEEETILISKSINRCIALLNESAKSDTFNNSLNTISDENIDNLRDSLNQLGNQKERVNANIRKIRDEMTDKKNNG